MWRRWVSNNWEWMIWVQSWLRPFHNRFAVTSRVAADAVSMSLSAPLPTTANSESYVVSKKPFLWREQIKNCFLTKLFVFQLTIKIICTELTNGVGEEHSHFAFTTEHWVKPFIHWWTFLSCPPPTPDGQNRQFFLISLTVECHLLDYQINANGKLTSTCSVSRVLSLIKNGFRNVVLRVLGILLMFFSNGFW